MVLERGIVTVNIYKNFINKKHCNLINKILLSYDFPWYYSKTQTHYKDSSYLFHCFYKQDKINSDFFYLIEPILNKINPKKLYNVRANLSLKRPSKCNWHRDGWEKNKKHNTAIYYVNTNNGYTEFKKNSIKSEKNKIVLFCASLIHRAVNQTDKDTRIVINLNYELN